MTSRRVARDALLFRLFTTSDNTPLIMGWFTSSSTQEPSPPDREKRRKCWETRDAYFACLDRVGVVKAGEEENACSEDRKRYETNCAKSWVYLWTALLVFWCSSHYVRYQIEYFNQRRAIGEAQKERLARGQWILLSVRHPFQGFYYLFTSYLRRSIESYRIWTFEPQLRTI